MIPEMNILLKYNEYLFMQDRVECTSRPEGNTCTYEGCIFDISI